MGGELAWGIAVLAVDWAGTVQVWTANFALERQRLREGREKRMFRPRQLRGRWRVRTYGPLTATWSSQSIF